MLQVETLDRYFENVCELDIMFNLEKVRSMRCVVVGCCEYDHDIVVRAAYSPETKLV